MVNALNREVLRLIADPAMAARWDALGFQEEPQPASKFISKGFARGSAPDNLVFLPFGGRKGELSDELQQRAAAVCPACGDLAVIGGVCGACGAS